MDDWVEKQTDRQVPDRQTDTQTQKATRMGGEIDRQTDTSGQIDGHTHTDSNTGGDIQYSTSI